MKYTKINPVKLKGEVKIPPSKSISHRALICAGLSKGITNIKNIIFSEDINATCNAISNFGACVEIKKDEVKIKGISKFDIRDSNINCFESGSTLRFLIPIAAVTGESVTFHGKGKLAYRPLTPYYDIFRDHNIFYKNDDGKLPMTVKGKLKPGEYKLKGNISSQFITGLLFSLPLLNGYSSIIVTTELESRPYVDLTLDVLRKFSINIQNNNYRRFIVKGNQEYRSCNSYNVEGDFSQVVFWAIASILGEKIVCKNVHKDSIQGDKIVIDILKEMGAEMEVFEDYIIFKPSNIHGTTIDASQCPDLIPALAALAAVSSGTTNIINAGRLRFKECDRLHAITSELDKIGADISEKKDGLLIHGKEVLKGGTVFSWNDHRIVMALACISSKCKEPLIIKDSECVKKSYPGFWNDFKMLGGNLDEWNVGE